MPVPRSCCFGRGGHIPSATLRIGGHTDSNSWRVHASTCIPPRRKPSCAYTATETNDAPPIFVEESCFCAFHRRRRGRSLCRCERRHYSRYGIVACTRSTATALPEQGIQG